MTPRQMPLEKLTPEARAELERNLTEDIGKVEARAEAEKKRRADWNKAQDDIRKGISQTARKIREDNAISPEEAEYDMTEANEITSRMVNTEHGDESDPG